MEFSRSLMMRVSCSKNFILFHVPRTGGSSVIAALDEELFVRALPTLKNKVMSKYLYFIPRPLENTYFRAHETAAGMRRLLPEEMFNNYCKITFVRNPFSWLVSLYEFVLHDPSHRHFERITKMGSFDKYIDWEIRRNKRNQYPYLLDRRGRLLVDAVGRFERLADDAARIFRSIGVDLKPLPHIGQFTRKDYRQYYDDESRRKVEAHWARDLDLFGYDFDGLAEEYDPLPRANVRTI
jgi:hypothetical protein